MHYSEMIRHWRKQKVVTQDRLARELKTNRDYVSRWENGHEIPNDEQIKGICHLFSLSPVSQNEFALAIQKARKFHEWSKFAIVEFDQDEFFGREADEDRLISACIALPDQEKIRVIVVTGLSGIGKSALIAKIIQNKAFQDKYKGNWIHLDVHGLSEMQMWRELALILNIENPCCQVDELKVLIRKELGVTGSLLILDGVDQKINLHHWLKASPERVCLLITTNRNDLLEDFPKSISLTMNIGPIDRTTAKTILLNGNDVDVNEIDIDVILDSAAGIPLVLVDLNRNASIHQTYHGMAEYAMSSALFQSNKFSSSTRIGLALEKITSELTNDGRILLSYIGMIEQQIYLDQLKNLLAWDLGRIRCALSDLLCWNLLEVRGKGGYYITNPIVRRYATEILARNYTSESVSVSI